MNASIGKINQQMAYLDARYLNELQLFVEFLLNKQQQSKTQIKKNKKQGVLAGMQIMEMPVNSYTVQRDEIYESRI